ncbi:MAG: hypothetical protein SGCHY_004573, partial [Lobulomycetales sp.]
MEKANKKSQIDPEVDGAVASVTYDKSKTLRKTGVGILLVLVGFLGVASQLLSVQFNTQLQSLHMKASQLLGFGYHGSAMCSGHGISLGSGKCLCDLGFAGPVCDVAVLSDLTEPIKGSILLVTDHFGPSLNLDKKFESESTLALAQTLSKGGYRVSVVYTVPTTGDDTVFSSVKQDMASQGVNLVRIEPTGVSYGESASVEALSYEVYQFIINQEDQYEFVHFSATSGAGYYTLLAQSQGLICSATKFVVSLDDLNPSEIKRRGQTGTASADLVITDAAILKKDYIVQKTLELSSTLVVSSQFLLDNIREQAWEIDATVTHVIESIPSVNIAGPGGKYSDVNELVFVGNLNALDGLKVFCEAVDIAAADLSKAGISISFAGVPDMIDDVPSAEWIEIYAGNWQEYGLEWQIVKAHDSSDILEHLAEKPGRIAVLPSLFDANSVVGQELLYAGFPFVASTQSALKKQIISEE